MRKSRSINKYVIFGKCSASCIIARHPDGITGRNTLDQVSSCVFIATAVRTSWCSHGTLIGRDALKRAQKSDYFRTV